MRFTRFDHPRPPAVNTSFSLLVRSAPAALPSPWPVVSPLIELMVVLVIIGVLAALIVPNVLERADDARVTAARTDITNIMQALKLYRLDNQRYPTGRTGPVSPGHQAPLRAPCRATGSCTSKAAQRPLGPPLPIPQPRHQGRDRRDVVRRRWPVGRRRQGRRYWQLAVTAHCQGAPAHETGAPSEGRHGTGFARPLASSPEEAVQRLRGASPPGAAGRHQHHGAGHGRCGLAMRDGGQTQLEREAAAGGVTRIPHAPSRAPGHPGALARAAGGSVLKGCRCAARRPLCPTSGWTPAPWCADRRCCNWAPSR